MNSPRRSTLRAGLALALAATAACDPGASKPAEPVWNKQPCAYCMMLLSDKRTAAQVSLASGERRFFDDVGCLVSYLDAEHVEPRSAWVRSPDGHSWVPAASARFASGAVTPMNFGFVPADSGISYAELVEQVRARAKRLEGAPR